jgi:NADH:ubiquinone oxidoreductase subunit F (NADH-binding)/NADH:ubiquinone oxidoreductase subunit E
LIELTPHEKNTIDNILSANKADLSALIPILQAIQAEFRYLPRHILQYVAANTAITAAEIAGVSTFYSNFRHQPVGKHLISVCHGTACHVKGAEGISDAITRHLKLSENNDTDVNGEFTLQKVACLGCCTLAPCMQIDGVTYGHLTPATIARAIADFKLLVSRGKAADRYDPVHAMTANMAEIRIGVGSCCVAGGSMDVMNAINDTIAEDEIAAVVKPVGCVGMCHQTPLVEIVPAKGGSELFARVDAASAPDIIRKKLASRGILRRIKNAVNHTIDSWITDGEAGDITRYSIDTRDPQVCAFLGRQQHIATEFCGFLAPLDINEYIKFGGFAGLQRALNISRSEIINEVITSGLRGRGGAGFPTGKKWQLVAAETGEKVIICNGDEGDPGAFMDRMLLESYPFRVLEGMAIAAHAVGATSGYLYIRSEYPLAVKRIREAIAICEEIGYLGDNIMESNINLKLQVKEGAGAFVCGEETALIASIEGERGMPRLRPPYPASKGLWGKPTLINNVESYACIPWIMRNGGDDFAALGTTHSHGTKVFALAGKITRGGLIEVPMGITLREVIDDIGGGAANDKKLKAVQIGGPSGGCIPAEECDISIDYEELTRAGAIMGSGGLVVIDEDDCMVDIARFFLQFTQEQSCGKCTFCRIGTRRMLDILEKICSGKGKPADIDHLEKLAIQIKKASLCGLGQTAPNPVLSTLRYYRHEYEAHLKGKCPAGKCKALTHYTVKESCIGCTKCAQNCPVDAIRSAPYRRHKIEDDKCTRCDICRTVCPTESIVKE